MNLHEEVPDYLGEFLRPDGRGRAQRYAAHKTGKLLSHVKYSSKRSDFLRFYAYLCHVIDDFCSSLNAALR